MAPQPEQQARRNIDVLLEAAGWHVCDASAANIHAARGVAIREFPLPGYGFADYLLYVDGKAAGVIEAKKEGVTLTYHPENRHDRKPTWSAVAEGPSTGSGRTDSGTGPDGRWRAYDYEDLVNRDKASLDIFWLKDESLSDSDNLPAPAEIVEDLEAALEQFREILADMDGVSVEASGS